MMRTPSRIGRELSIPVNALLGCAGLRIERSSSPLGRAFSSAEYWEKRYAVGGSSGAGSYGRLAHFKAEVLNDLIARHDIRTLIEWGCGDGHQSSLLEVDDYLGVDISESSVRHCRASHERLDHRIGRRAYRTVAEHLQSPVSARDCSISLDVVYHLTEDSVYEEYMRNLFASASRLVVVYASNNVPAAATPSHIRHRAFTSWVAANQPEWALAQFIPNRYPFALGDPDETSFADFYVYAAPTS